MEVIFYDFNPDHIYWVNYKGEFRQCKPLYCYHRGIARPCIVAKVAGIDDNVEFEYNRSSCSDLWYYASKFKTNIAESLEDLRKQKYVEVRYGDTDNCYNTKVMQPLFPHFSVCNCGGTIYSYIWLNNYVELISLTFKDNSYIFDKDGFHFNGNENPKLIDAYVSGKFHNRINTENMSIDEFYIEKENCVRENEDKVVVATF